MELNFGILPTLIGWAAALFVIYGLLYYRYIYSVVDPLFMFIFTTAFASVLAIQIIPETKDLIHFFGCQISLWIGFAFAYRQTNFLHKDINPQKVVFDFSHQLLLRWTTYSLFVVYIISNLIIGYAKGFALFSDAPSEAKFLNFQAGFGLFRKINWSAGTFVSTSLMYMYFSKQRKVDLLFLIIVIFFSSLDGSKAALLQVAISAGIIFYHPVFADRQKALKKFQRYLPLVFAGIMGVFFTVLLKENDDLEGAFFAFIRRLLYSADSILYFYTDINLNYFANYSFWDYIPRLLNPILGFLRIQPYHEALGNIMYDNIRPPNAIGDVVAGPNAPFYIEGRIYFYYWAAFPFSAILGYLYAIIRIHYFSLTKASAFYFVYMASFSHLAHAIIIDLNLAISQSFDLAFFILPVYVLISFLVTRKLSIRISPNLIKYLNKSRLASP
jgi:oligosaccharide repeat unit polymerase